jgi:hypothetical protein
MLLSHGLEHVRNLLSESCLLGDDCDHCNWETVYGVLSWHGMEDGDFVQPIGQHIHEGSEYSNYGLNWVHCQAWLHSHGFTDAEMYGSDCSDALIDWNKHQEP